mmetsp:Transcript_13860/g.20781  ORF Transcript_13860/g.20781 Transcript_13860/m.20781 type:complete len:314 (-) Transcript_13860:68-1009(-)
MLYCLLHFVLVAPYQALISPQHHKRITARQVVSIENVATADYAFMLPSSIAIATACQLVGIGGAALFSPTFLLVFPLLGCPQLDPVSAVACALITEAFGFSSGLTGYARRRLVDWQIARHELITSIPFALFGALSVETFAADPRLLRTLYCLLMFGLSIQLGTQNVSSCESHKNDIQVIATTALGATLTGLLGVGIGEVLYPRLIAVLPADRAAGTSVAVVTFTTAAAAIVQFVELVQVQGGLQDAIPWSLLSFTVPGVLIGGQVAPLLAGRVFADDDLRRAASFVFGFVGAAFATSLLTNYIENVGIILPTR